MKIKNINSYNTQCTFTFQFYTCHDGGFIFLYFFIIITDQIIKDQNNDMLNNETATKEELLNFRTMPTNIHAIIFF